MAKQEKLMFLKAFLISTIIGFIILFIFPEINLLIPEIAFMTTFSAILKLEHSKQKKESGIVC